MKITELKKELHNYEVFKLSLSSHDPKYNEYNDEEIINEYIKRCKLNAIIKRNYLPKQTQGLFEVLKYGKCTFSCKSLELPWLNNARGISCIFEDIYYYTKEIQKTRGKILRFHDVEGRSGVLVHVLNFSRQSKGCIGIGDDFSDIDNDGLLDVINSRTTLDKLWDMLPESGYIEIKS